MAAVCPADLIGLALTEPVKLDPFIEAEEAGGRSVQHCCDMFEVSSAAYYVRRQAIPSARELSDAELTEKILAIHAESDGTYGSPLPR
jgi:hypothetical protein